MVLALNTLQRLICHKTQTTNQFHIFKPPPPPPKKKAAIQKKTSKLFTNESELLLRICTKGNFTVTLKTTR